MLNRKQRFFKWLKAFNLPMHKGLFGKYYWLFKWRPGRYASWEEFRDSLFLFDEASSRKEVGDELYESIMRAQNLMLSKMEIIYYSFPKLTFKFEKEGKNWTAYCKELGTATYAKTFKKAEKRIKEAVLLHIDTLRDVEEDVSKYIK